MVALLQRALSATVVLTALTSMGCASQSKFLDDQDWTRERGHESVAWRETESLLDEDESDADRFKAEPRGVRHDLTMGAKAEPTARCNCLDVIVTTSATRELDWAGEMPLLSKRHLLFSMRPRDEHCKGGQAITRPSIRAVDTYGKHIIVVVEELPIDRPAAQGAIIPKPQTGGAVWIRSYKKRHPYGGTQSLPDPNLTKSQSFFRRLCKVYGEPKPEDGRLR